MRLPFFIASRFVAGETLGSALPVVEELRTNGINVSLNLLGEYVEDRQIAEEARDTYIRIARTLARRYPERTSRHDVKISVKLSMIGQKIEKAYCLDNLLQLLEVAAAEDIFIRLDMEGSDTTDSTLSIFEEVHEHFPDHVGPVLQAMLKRTERDIERMCELGASVRLCKGAYKEPSSIAYQDMEEIRERFLCYMERLLKDGHYPGIATHDDRLIEAAKQLAETNGIQQDGFELQMIYGMRPATQQALADAGYRMMVYVPYGTEWLPYFWRRLQERKENVWFVLKNLFRA